MKVGEDYKLWTSYCVTLVSCYLLGSDILISTIFLVVVHLHSSLPNKVAEVVALLICI
jgi:hypothetical protein